MSTAMPFDVDTTLMSDVTADVKTAGLTLLERYTPTPGESASTRSPVRERGGPRTSRPVARSRRGSGGSSTLPRATSTTSTAWEWAVTATLVRDNQPVLTVVHLPRTSRPSGGSATASPPCSSTAWSCGCPFPPRCSSSTPPPSRSCRRPPDREAARASWVPAASAPTSPARSPPPDTMSSSAAAARWKAPRKHGPPRLLRRPAHHRPHRGHRDQRHRGAPPSWTGCPRAGGRAG